MPMQSNRGQRGRFSRKLRSVALEVVICQSQLDTAFRDHSSAWDVNRVEAQTHAKEHLPTKDVVAALKPPRHHAWCTGGVGRSSYHEESCTVPSGLGQALYFLRELYHAINLVCENSIQSVIILSTKIDQHKSSPVRKPVACCILEKDTWYNNCTDADLPKQTSLRLVTAVFDALADSSSIPPEFWPQFSSGHPAGRAPMNLWGTFPKQAIRHSETLRVSTALGIPPSIFGAGDASNINVFL
ncbi:uncharacterized protein EI90DRAFT_3172937 [Cantharellus anzutake]|uniref:uncharacterized protein n=1 Tax=Cantharellus anzutake TaxID=1750568 RepID=UPI0019084780|nr:uncharacterized protein EI90DRAFT_3172937 [Cantharellus anzutake]KAF8335999.1 hypothetical protein EI90DRAFT_3172937 [Cantharellus anzutake]